MARALALAFLLAVSLAQGSPQVERCHAESLWRNQSLWNFTGAFERCGTSSTCVQGHGCDSSCAADEDCANYPMRRCTGHGPAAKCEHKTLFGLAAGRDVASAAAFFVISGLALSAGIGGGGLYVPLLMLLLGFTAHEATGLSQALLAGGASSTLVYNMRQRHPSGSKPMIDYGLILVMGPNLLIGALIGSSLNVAAPSWLILVLLTGILSHSAYKTLRKAVATLRKERAGEVQGMHSADGRLSKNAIERCLRWIRARCGCHGRFEDPHPDVEPPTGDAGKPACPPQFADAEDPEAATDEKDCQAGTAVATSDQHLPQQQEKATADAKAQAQYPRAYIAQFVFMWLLVVSCILARGGKASSGLVSFCGQAYWILTSSTVVALALMGLVGAQHTAGAPAASLDKGEFHLTPGSARRVAMYALGAGVISALCGIGGGMIMGPLLLDLGVLPQVQSATTASTLFVLSSASALAFLVQGAAPMDYAIFLAFITASGAVVGKVVLGFLIKLYRRPSAIIFLLGGIILASVLVMATTGFIDVVNEIRHGKSLGFKSVCPTE